MMMACRYLIRKFSHLDSKVYGANMGPILGRKDTGGPHVGPMNFAIWTGFLNLQGMPVPFGWSNKNSQLSGAPFTNMDYL